MVITIATLGDTTETSRATWAKYIPNSRIVQVEHVARSGRRLGKRALGIGLDSAALALKARIAGRADATLATNPWPGMACRLAGLPNVAVAGIYAQPGTRSWRLLRRGLRDSPVVCMSHVESDAWQADGGRSASVLYGATFHVPMSKPPLAGGAVRIFVGGTSDRDPEVVSNLVSQVQKDAEPVDLVIADGSGPAEWSGNRASVTWLPFVSQQEFIATLAACHVSFLPLANKGRAAGHMVLCASLEAGLPTVVRVSSGVREYLEQAGPTPLDESQPLLSTLLSAAHADDVTRAHLHEAWSSTFSRDASIHRLVEALGRLGWPGVFAAAL